MCIPSMKYRVKCRNKDNLTGRNKPSQEPKLWFHMVTIVWFVNAKRLEGRPVKRGKNGDQEGEPGVDTDSVFEHEDEAEFVPPSVYFLTMDSNQDCIHKIPKQDRPAIFQELCGIIARYNCWNSL